MKKPLTIIFKYNLPIFFFVVAFSTCNTPDELPTSPIITFNDIIYYDVEAGIDSLVLKIDFTDGDGDLGLEAFSSTDQSISLDAIRPYHDFEAITDSNGKFVTIHSESSSFPWYKVFPIERGGEVFGNIDDRTDFSCLDYEVGYLNSDRNFFTSDTRIFDPNNQSDIKFFSKIGDFTNVNELFLDTVYVHRNENRYNILVEYFVKRNGKYEVFDWLTAFDETACLGIDYNGRFPVFDQSNLESKSSLEGTLKYAMFSSGFKISFRNDTLKLRIKIKDRQLHDSNIIETPDFTLQGVSKN